MDGLDEVPMAEYDVECHTEGCGNAGYVIRIWASETGPYIVCGPCGQVITDFVIVPA